eukprot:8592613-Pyramimonas_sp.AAC.1
MFLDPDVAISVRGAIGFQNVEDVPSEAARQISNGMEPSMSRFRALLPRRGAHDTHICILRVMS